MSDKDSILIWESFNEGSTKETEIAVATQALGRAVQALYNADLNAEDIMKLAANVIPDAIKAFPRIYEPGKSKFDD